MTSALRCLVILGLNTGGVIIGVDGAVGTAGVRTCPELAPKATGVAGVLLCADGDREGIFGEEGVLFVGDGVT